MKKSFKSNYYLLVALPLLFMGCQKTEVTNDSPNAEANALKSIAYCGTTSTAHLYYFYDQNQVKTDYGTVTVGNDLNNVYVTYTLSGDWTFMTKADGQYNWGSYLFVGSEAELTLLNPVNKIEPDLTGFYEYQGFDHYEPIAAGEKTYTYTIPRSKITVDCPIIVAFAAVTNGSLNRSVSARSLFKGQGYWFTHCMQTCTSGSGTAYAFGGDLAKCFLNTPGITSNNWGWTNKIGPGTYDWPIYAGAGQCDISKGTLVGTLHIVYTPPAATITYNMGAGVSLGATHLSVFMDPKMLPKDKKGNYITAPGQFPYTGNSVTVTGLSGDIWVAAHSEVSW